MREIVVVGGGPAGLLSAIEARKYDVDVLVLESKNEIGKTEHCAGLLSINGLKKIGLEKLPLDIIQNKEIIGAKIFSARGSELIVEKKSHHALVVNRSKFNKYLASIAHDLGIEINTNSRVKKIQRNSENVELILGKHSKRNKIMTKISILAEGRFPKLNSQVGLPYPNDIIFASQFIINGVKDLDKRYVELYQISEYAPGFFGWIIPINDEIAKVGIGSRYRPAKRYLRNFIFSDLLKKRFHSFKILKEMSGAIPLGSFIRRSYTDNILVVGDAAGQTKPTTGGGVILGGIAARIAGEIAAKAVIEGNYTKSFLKQYEKRWKKEFARNLLIMKLVRHYLDSLDDKEIDDLVKMLNKQKYQKIFTSKGDVDNQQAIVWKLLTKLELWPFLIKTGLKFTFKKKKW
ncbi:MAG: NAD(P)/FAD-dependent oxidoreductase [Candidatus Heimdallarchaeum endolithica]|uniref:NAD(P)/FAD-dependent oxidoreductase n=1 Tax=Candidatus Heimdallarchaeum endolithica TaxID=2876572 RepID=A0A9Y1BQ78_9ARCH|nr:MAG: NAD(P)/FAD-dependent oxidoreductase [Candidatus Heimdallarchaeum endolithica]